MDKLQVKKVIFLSVICNTLLWYDYMLFGSLISIISNTFFPNNDYYVSLIATLGVFAAGFLMRPLGAIIFGYIGDKYGRRIALLFSIILMSVSSITIAIIPSYQRIGMLAPILVTVLRLLQGISLGGEAGNATFLIEHASDKKRGFFGSIEVLSAIIGSAMSLIAILVCRKISDFDFWGWRLPFAFGLFIGLISIYFRYILSESPAYKINKKHDKLSKSPFIELIRYYKKPVLIAIGIDIVENSSLYIFLIFFKIFIEEAAKMSIGFIYTIEIISQVSLAILTLLFAMLSDSIGRKKVMIPAFITFTIISLPTLLMLSSSNNLIVTVAYFIFMIPIAASLGPVSATMCELFPTKVRYSGMSLSRNIAAGFFGGLGPFICTWLMKQIKIGPSFYMIFCALIGLIAILQIKDKDLKVDF
ncbi:MAG: MFS transporter [Wolbachia endosymbiont of Xenopsylla cheopis]